MINREKLAGCNNLLIALLDKIELEILSPIGCQLTITSGYRDAQKNTEINGSKTSLHLKGLAADIVVSGYHVFKLAGDIMKKCRLSKDLRTFLEVNHGELIHIGINEQGEIIELAIGMNKVFS